MSSRRNQLSEEQVKQLERLSDIWGEAVRKKAAAILELNRGDSLRIVAQNSGFKEGTVRGWWKSWEEGGAQGLIPKQLPKAKAIELEQKLEDAQAERDRVLVKAKEALVKAKEYDRQRWIDDNVTDDALRYTLKTIISLLPAIDALDLAFEKLPEDLSENPWVEGISTIHANFEKWLKRYKIEAIDPTAGDRFDPNFHQTIGTQDSDEVESGHVTETLRKGYQAGEIVLRDALVRIAS